ncbi:MAG: hypothetical protein AB3A66_17005 [Nodularia sp. CChRGM 3473]
MAGVIYVLHAFQRNQSKVSLRQNRMLI